MYQVFGPALLSHYVKYAKLCTQPNAPIEGSILNIPVWIALCEHLKIQSMSECNFDWNCGPVFFFLTAVWKSLIFLTHTHTFLHAEQFWLLSLRNEKDQFEWLDFYNTQFWSIDMHVGGGIQSYQKESKLRKMLWNFLCSRH